MIRRRPARVTVICSVLVALPLAIVCVSGAACGSEPQLPAAERAGTPAEENAANVRTGERGTRAENVPSGQDGAAKPSGSSDETQAGPRTSADNRAKVSAKREPDPDPAGAPVAAASDGFGVKSLLDGGPIAIAIAAVGLVVVIVVVSVGLMLFRRRTGVVKQAGSPVQGERSWPDPVNHRQVDEPNPRSENPSQPPESVAPQPGGRRADGTEIAKLAGEIKQLQLRVERLESLEQRVNEIDGVVASLYSGDEMSRAARALPEPGEVPGFTLEQREASLTPVTEDRARQLAFPARVSECIALVRERGMNSVLAAKTMVPGTLERAVPGPHASFLLVDEDVARGRYFALPNRQRLAEAQEYHTYYRDYYDCASPSSGNLIVQSAAVVRETSGEWTLETRGVLSVEQ